MSRLFAGTPFEKPSTCPICGKPPADCRCVILPPKKTMSERAGGGGKAKSTYELGPQNSTPPRDQVAKIRVEKRKGNREVTVITGLDHPGNDLQGLLADLKSKLGTGGSVQGRTIEIQGDQASTTAELLAARGTKARVL